MYLLAKEGNTGINLRLRVLSVIFNRTLVIYLPVRAFMLELLVSSYMVPHLVCIRLTFIFCKA
jgi:hypothetical protein